MHILKTHYHTEVTDIENKTTFTRLATRAIAVNEELRELIIKARRGGLNQATYLTQKLGWYLKENQIKHFTFHQLRATYATKLYETGTPYEVINQLLGHRSIETTKAYINQLKRSKPVEFVNPYN